MHDSSDHYGSSDRTDHLRVIRKLLTRAESTDFEAEREACLAKVAELTARHSIEEALIWSRHRHEERIRPVQRFIDVPPPYTARKVVLFGAVGAHHGCTVIDLGTEDDGSRRVAVVGFPGDVERTEVLVTSLLLQLTRAMLAPGCASKGPAISSQVAAASTAAYRRSFITAFAWRVGERLAEIRRAQEAEAEADGHEGAGKVPSVALVLADREDAVQQEVQRHYPFLRHRKTNGGSSPAGYAAGRAAAERAELQHAHLPNQAAALPR
jgi:hypothetical protein